jgi:hypothetical protein
MSLRRFDFVILAAVVTVGLAAGVTYGLLTYDEAVS